MPRIRFPRSLAGAALTALATAVLVVPLASSTAEAGGNRSRKTSGESMRLGGPSASTGRIMRLGGPANRNGRMMRLGGSAPRPVDSGIYAIPGRLVSNNPDDVRLFFLRHAEAGSGGGR